MTVQRRMIRISYDELERELNAQLDVNEGINVDKPGCLTSLGITDGRVDACKKMTRSEILALVQRGAANAPLPRKVAPDSWLIISTKPSRCCRAPSMIVRSRSGKFVTQDCLLCGQKTDYVGLDEIPDLDCVGCRSAREMTTEPTVIRQELLVQMHMLRANLGDRLDSAILVRSLRICRLGRTRGRQLLSLTSPPMWRPSSATSACRTPSPAASDPPGYP
jgi:hypothetical protein